jgi:hypothetical protein
MKELIKMYVIYNQATNRKIVEILSSMSKDILLMNQNCHYASLKNRNYSGVFFQGAAPRPASSSKTSIHNGCLTSYFFLPHRGKKSGAEEKNSLGAPLEYT